MGRAKAKKEEDMWKAVARDMKKKGANYRKPGDMPPPRRAPKPPTPKKPKAPTPKPRNKRTGQDYLDTTRSMAGQIARRQRSPVPQRRPKK